MLVDNNDDTSISDYSCTEEQFQCAALHCCKHWKFGKKKSNWILDDKQTIECSICLCQAHLECVVDKVYKNSKDKNQRINKQEKICLHCSLHDDGERTPFKPDEKFESDKIPVDDNAALLTIDNLNLGKRYTSFNKLTTKLDNHNGKVYNVSMLA